MPKQSAGLLLYRLGNNGLEVLIVHPGGPFWAKRDLGAWSIPKGEFQQGEAVIEAAKREFQEEVGIAAPIGEYINLGSAKQASGKVVFAFAFNSDCDLENFRSNMFTMEWPPKSGVQQEFPECDRAAWVAIGLAKQKLVKGQVPLLLSLAEKLHVDLINPEGPEQASLF